MVVVGKHTCSLELQFSATLTVRLSPVVHHDLAHHVCVGGISAFVGIRTRRVVEELLRTHEPVDREVFGESDQIRGCTLRGQLSDMEPGKPLTPFSRLISQGLSSVSPKSCLRFVLADGVSEAQVTFGRAGPEGTEQIRPDGVGPYRSAAAHCGTSTKGRR